MDYRILLHARFKLNYFALVPLALRVLALTCLLYANPSTAQTCGQFSGVNIVENFNSLPTTGSTIAIPLPAAEFGFTESPGNFTYAADNGSNATGDTYSYGSNGSTDRALGEITTTTVSSKIGACFVNKTDHAITTLVISYTGEEWRLGAADATVDRLDFQYSTDATTILTGTYLNVDALDFTTPNNTGAGAKDGNSVENRTVFAPIAITPPSPIRPQATVYFRWIPSNITGANDALAIDDFIFGAALAPEIAGDYDNNGVVDANDYVVWRKQLTKSVTIPNDVTPGSVVAQDYVEWRDRFGKKASQFAAGSAIGVPEPGTSIFLVTMVGLGCRLRQRQPRSNARRLPVDV